MSLYKTRLVVAVSILLAAVAAHAQTLINMEGSPAGWRLQDYAGGTPPTVVVWFTPSSCTNGQLTFPSNATIDDQNRFWSLIMAAKIANQTVGVYYYVSGSACVLQSFYLTP